MNHAHRRFLHLWGRRRSPVDADEDAVRAPWTEAVELPLTTADRGRFATGKPVRVCERVMDAQTTLARRPTPRWLNTCPDHHRGRREMPKRSVRWIGRGPVAIGNVRSPRSRHRNTVVSRTYRRIDRAAVADMPSLPVQAERERCNPWDCGGRGDNGSDHVVTLRPYRGESPGAGSVSPGGSTYRSS